MNCRCRRGRRPASFRSSERLASIPSRWPAIPPARLVREARVRAVPCFGEFASKDGHKWKSHYIRAAESPRIAAGQDRIGMVREGGVGAFQAHTGISPKAANCGLRPSTQRGPNPDPECDSCRRTSPPSGGRRRPQSRHGVSTARPWKSCWPMRKRCCAISCRFIDRLSRNPKAGPSHSRCRGGPSPYNPRSTGDHMAITRSTRYRRSREMSHNYLKLQENLYKKLHVQRTNRHICVIFDI